MDLGVAASIAVKQFGADGDIDEKVNQWLSANQNIEVIDIKFSASATCENWGTDALIIYRKEN